MAKTDLLQGTNVSYHPRKLATDAAMLNARWPAFRQAPQPESHSVWMANGPDPRHPHDLTDEQWALVGPFLPAPPCRSDGRGRPWRANRPVLNGILWVLRTGAPWADLPDRYPAYQTCHRRFQHWVPAGLLRSILEILAQTLHDEGFLDLQEAFIDGSFAPAKQGGAAVLRTALVRLADDSIGRPFRLSGTREQDDRHISAPTSTAPRTENRHV